MAVAYSHSGNVTNFAVAVVRHSALDIYQHDPVLTGVSTTAKPNPVALTNKYKFLNPPWWSEMSGNPPSGWILP